MNDDDVVEDVPPESSDTQRRRWVPMALVVLAAVLAIVSTLTAWVRAELLDTDEWVQTSSSLLAEQEVQDALATYLSGQLLDRIDTAAAIESILPGELTRLSNVLGGMVEGAVDSTIHRWIGSEQFRRHWSEANRLAHGSFVAILRDETRPGTSAADGVVALELGDVVRSVGERVGLSPHTLDLLPPDAGRIVIFESDQLASAQRMVPVLDALSWFMYVVVVVLYIVAVVLARGRRLVMLRNVGLSLVVAGIALLVLRSLGARVAVNALVTDPWRIPIAGIVAEVATQLVVEMAWNAILYGVLITGFALLLGGARWAVDARRRVGDLTSSVPAAITVALLAVGLLLVWSPGAVFDRWVSAVVFTAATVGAVVTLVVVSRREHQGAFDGAPSTG